MINNFFDRIVSNIVGEYFYIKSRIKCKYYDFVEGIKSVFTWLPTIWADRDFDFAFMWLIERKKLQKYYKYFSTSEITELGHVCKYIKICLNLVDYLLEEKSYLKQVKPFDQYKSLEEFFNDKRVYRFDHYINLKNAKRFLQGEGYQNVLQENIERIKDSKPEDFRDVDGIDLDELYKIKARALYYKILNEKIIEWWD